MKSILYIVNDPAFFLSHRLPVARAAARASFKVSVAAEPSVVHEEKIRSLGFGFHPIPIDRHGKSPRRDAALCRALIRLYSETRPDIVHHITIKPVLYGSLAARVARVPAVVNAFTGLGHLFLDQSMGIRIIRKGFKGVLSLALRHPNMRVIFQNTNDLDALRIAIPTGSEVIIRGSGVDTETFASSPEPLGVPIVLLPARLIYEKGIAEFVDAARMLRSRNVEVRMVLAGPLDPGRPGAVQPQQVAQWQSEGVVEWWGNRSDMAQVYRDAHIACLPSHGEGLPKALLEAAACGRPIVTTDTPGCREIADGGKSALLVPPKDPKALAAAIERLVGDSDLRATLGSAGRALVEREFSERIVVESTLRVYESLLGRSSPS